MTLSLDDIERCFGGAIPAMLATASADGVPNVTYISRAHRVDGQRIALSNQFMSKTARNLTVNPRACLVLTDPLNHDEFRLSLAYERTERRGHVFERLKTDVEALAALEGMQDVFRLRSADVFRVLDIAQVPPNPAGRIPVEPERPLRAADPALDALGQLAACIARAGDLDVLVDVTLDGLDRLLGYDHTQLLLLDERGTALYTVASRGFDEAGIGAEIAVGQGQIGLCAQRCSPVRVGNLVQSKKYSRSIRERYEQAGVHPGRDQPLPGMADAQSRIAVPAMALGQLVGVLVAESTRPSAYNVVDEQILGVVATMVANALEHAGELDRSAEPPAPLRPAAAPAATAGERERLTVKYFDVDGSVFVDGEYLIKGVAGRILWCLLGQHAAEDRVEFTNRELRRDRALELPGVKDNLESRLLLLQRRLDERELPVRIRKTGRGRFRLDVTRALELVPGA